MRSSRRRQLFRTGARPKAAQVAAFIDDHRDQFGVEPICRVLELATSTYYVAKSRGQSARKRRDEELKAVITGVWDENFKV